MAALHQRGNQHQPTQPGQRERCAKAACAASAKALSARQQKGRRRAKAKHGSNQPSSTPCAQHAHQRAGQHSGQDKACGTSRPGAPVIKAGGFAGGA